MTRKSKKIVRKISAKFSNKQGGDIDAKELDIDITSLLCECDWKLVKRVFDLLFRSVMRHVDVAANFFESHIDPVYSSQIDFSKMKFWSPSHIDQNLKERIGDLLFIAPCRQTPDNPEQQQMNVSFICEHQSTVEHFMCIRAVEMAARDLTQFLDDLRIMIRREVEAKYVGEEVEIQFEILWQNVKVPYPMAVIVTNSKQHWKYKKMREVIAIPHKFDKNILNLPTFFIDISGLSEEELNRGMPVVRALKWAFRYDLDGTLVENHWRIFSILSEAAGDHRVKTWFFQFGTFILSRYEKNKIGKEDKRKFFKNIEKYYGQVTKDPKEVKQMTTTLLREIAKHRIRRSKKRGMQIGEKRGEKRGIQIGEERGMQIGEERGMQIGEERGMQIGEKRGEERGAIRGKREAVIRCLSIRFQNPIPQDINEKLESYSDLGVFDFLFQFAMTCESLDDFRKRLI